jgi:predicted GTPase
MPYGNLAEQAVQRFASLDDLDRHHCTIEEREEYEPHLARGVVVYAGVDYERILREAEQETDVILWDGGNNDFPFFRTDLLFVIADPHRAGHELTYHPGETNLRMAEVVIVSKTDTADREAVELIEKHVREVNPRARTVRARCPISVEKAEEIRGRRVLVVEDGPTLTHGEMGYGAGLVAATRYGAKVVDPRPYAVGSIAAMFRQYRNAGPVLPAMGYGPVQVEELGKTIAATPCDLVLIATPVDLRRVVRIEQPCQRVRYEMDLVGSPDLSEILAGVLAAATVAREV